MRVALYARTTTTAPAVAPILDGLATYAAQRGWQIIQQHTDQGPWPEGRREGLRSLLKAAREQTIQGVLVQTLGHLAHSLRHLADLGHRLEAQGIALIALEDDLDTTDPAGALRWNDWIHTAHRLDRQLRAEAARIAHQRTPETRWGRPPAAINPLELLTLWEGRAGRHPLPLRQIAQKLGVSEATTRKHLQSLRAAGKVDDGARTRALSRHPHRRGGRPTTPLDDDTLRAAWKTHQSISTVARNLRVSRSRVKTRLQELGLAEGLIPNDAAPAAIAE